MYSWNLYLNQPVLLIDVARNTLGWVPFFHIVILRDLYNDGTCKLEFFVLEHPIASQIVSVDYLKEPAPKEFDGEKLKELYENALVQILKGKTLKRTTT